MMDYFYLKIGTGNLLAHDRLAGLNPLTRRRRLLDKMAARQRDAWKKLYAQFTKR
jgi:hypothetical protein